jgi:hypothetical protein
MEKPCLSWKIDLAEIKKIKETSPACPMSPFR